MSVLKGLIEYQLNTMSFKRKDALKTIDFLQDEIAVHLAKIILYNDTDRKEQIHHWQSEIIAWLDRIDNHANSVKKQGKLKLEDYIKSLEGLRNGDRIVRSAKITELDCNKWKRIDSHKVYDIVYSILLGQYHRMAQGRWDIDTLLNNPVYSEVSK